MLVVPAQTPGVRDRYGLTKADTDRAPWAFDGEGRRHEGAAAINRALAELRGAWPAVAAAYRAPLLRQLEDGGYGMVVRTRQHLSLLTRTPPECDDPAVDCGPD